MSELRDPRPAPTRVLVVEDDPDTRRLLVTSLAEEGYEPIAALDGRHALRTALATGPQAILLDLMLPEADGAEFVREYREHLRTAAATPIVVVSARHDACEVARRMGARDCIRKPFEVSQLMERLAAVMRGDEGTSPRPVVA
jgi:two-component system KDP operon response regulator KdpE